MVFFLGWEANGCSLGLSDFVREKLVQRLWEEAKRTEA